MRRLVPPVSRKSRCFARGSDNNYIGGRVAATARSLKSELRSGSLTFAYTGDTEWTDALLELARDADLLVSEAYFAEKPVKFHLTLAALREHLVEMRPKRVILTHMSEDVLRSDVEFEKAYDGMTVRLEC